MHALRDATTDVKFDYFRRHLDLQIQAASAWITHAEGHDDQALALFTSTADAEDALGKHPVTPGALMPVREQLGRFLLELKRPHEAMTEFVAELKIYPARFRALYGAGIAAERNGDEVSAQKYFAQLVKQAASGDAARDELAHARSYLKR